MSMTQGATQASTLSKQSLCCYVGGVFHSYVCTECDIAVTPSLPPSDTPSPSRHHPTTQHGPPPGRCRSVCQLPRQEGKHERPSGSAAKGPEDPPVALTGNKPFTRLQHTELCRYIPLSHDNTMGQVEFMTHVTLECCNQLAI